MKQYSREELLASAPLPKAMSALVLPTIVGQLATMVYNLTDTYFVGLTDDPLQVAAVTLTFPIYHIINALSNLYGVGGGSLISRLMGQGKSEKIKNVSAFCFYAALATALLYAAILLSFMKPLMLLSGASSDTLDFSSSYMLWAAVIGAIPTMLSLFISYLMRSEGHGKTAGFGMVLGGAVNIILDPIFIITLQMGVTGAAIATCISNVVSMLYYFAALYSVRRDTRLSLRFSDIKIKRELTAPIFAVGIPSAIYVAASSIATMVYNKLLSGFGDIIVAAAGIVKKAELLPLNICLGLSQGMIPLIAYNYAAGNHKRMNAVMRTSVALGVGICFASIILFSWKAEGIVTLFIREQMTVEYGVRFMRIMILATPLMTVNILMNSMFQAVGNGRSSIILSLCRQGIINIPIMFLLRYLFGMYGVIWAQLFADTLTLAVSLSLYSRFRRKLKAEQH